MGRRFIRPATKQRAGGRQRALGLDAADQKFRAQRGRSPQVLGRDAGAPGHGDRKPAGGFQFIRFKFLGVYRWMCATILSIASIAQGISAVLATTTPACGHWRNRIPPQSGGSLGCPAWRQRSQASKLTSARSSAGSREYANAWASPSWSAKMNSVGCGSLVSPRFSVSSVFILKLIRECV